MWAWGWNYFGQLGTAGSTDALKPVAVTGVEPGTSTAGPTHTVAVTARGQ